MLRTTPNSVKETIPRGPVIQDYKKQQSQPAVFIPDQNNFFHLQAKQYSRSKLQVKPSVSSTTSKSIEEKRKVNPNNRTNSSSKSRISGLVLDDDSMQSSQIKLKKIIGDSNFNVQILKQLSKQNLTSDSQSPGVRYKSGYKKASDLDSTQMSVLREKSLLHKKTQSLSVSREKELMDQLIYLEKAIQSSVSEQMKKQYFLRSRGLWDTFRESFEKQFCKSIMTHKGNLNNLWGQVKEIEQQWSELLLSISKGMFELFGNAAVLMACDLDSRYNELIESMRRDRDIWQSNFKALEQERDILLETISNLKQTVDKLKPQQMDKIENMDAFQLKEVSTLMQAKIQEMSEKEAKLIKLVLAIRKTGVDIEKIYNEEVLNDDSISQTERTKKNSIHSHHIQQSYHEADNSVVNDSDESSFCFQGRQDNDSIIESIRRFENRNINNLPDQKLSTVKLKLDLSKCHQQAQKQVSKIKIPDTQDIGFHQEFMQKFHEFSESWRVQAMKDERRTK